MGGFSTPILHGLCSFGIAVRQVMDTFANGDPTRLKEMKVWQRKLRVIASDPGEDVEAGAAWTDPGHRDVAGGGRDGEREKQEKRRKEVF